MTATETKSAPLKLRDDLKTELWRTYESCPVVAASGFDDNLLVLAETGGVLARSLGTPSNVWHRLLTIAAFAMQWSRCATGAQNWCSRASFVNALEFVRIERLRQRRLFAEGRITFDCASPVVDPRRKLRVLIEEIGEVAQEIDRVEQHPNSVSHRHDLAVELIQVAAVCVAWLESLEAA